MHHIADKLQTDKTIVTVGQFLLLTDDTRIWLQVQYRFSIDGYQFDSKTRTGTGRFIRRKMRKTLALIGGKLTAKNPECS